MAKPRPCVVPCCQGERSDLVHKFPSDKDRAETWRSILSIPELQKFDLDTIRGRYFVCTRHFRDSDYKNKLSRSLNVTANPSLNLFALNDEEGLNRIIPPMVRIPYTEPPKSSDDSREGVTVSLQVQPMLPEDKAHLVERNLVDDSSSAMSSSLEIVTIPGLPDESLFLPTKKHEQLRLQVGQKRTMAGCTPGKIFKFKRKSDIVVDFDDSKEGAKKSVVLRTVKIVSPKKEGVVPNKVSTVSTETQTEMDRLETRGNLFEQEETALSETNEVSKNTTKVLALLACTPENLQKLQKKLKEQAGGALSFDENLFQDLAADEPAEDTMVGQQSAVDERYFLTIPGNELVQPIHVSYIWLRDHCRCAECYNQETFQRSQSILDIPDDVRPANFTLTDRKLEVLWMDDHVSSYDLDFIFHSQYEAFRENLLREHAQPVLWDRDLISLCPEYCRVSLSELICEDAAVSKVVKSLVAYGVAFIQKVPPNQQSTEMAIKRIFPIHKTFFGEMWTFSDQMDHGDTAYTKNYLGLHTDNTYFCDASGLQVLHCIQFNGSGGETTLIDGFKAAEQLKLKDAEAFERLCNYPLTGEYLEEGKHHTYCAPVIKRNIITGEVEQLRFNTYDRAVLNTIPQRQIPQFYKDYKRLAAEINDETMAWQFQLTPGTVMIFDNWRVLHGRMAYSGKRVITGCYVSRTEYQSVARTLGMIS
ncbi:uncharacterized protein LOC129724615 [Wyeomyia smithii]|uniref:uncharacterized protein LOC129724615 n=1 Tax=Wyeomyia smithii TaxID=174621 RepID=UPI002467B02E|nr:uncharacterized protein LOC129724615 [Wyeomyia smithii]